MPDDINGNYSLPNGYLAVTGEKVLPSNHNPPLEDIAAALTARFSRDGRAPMLGNVPMNGFLIKGLGEGDDPEDAVNKSQLDTKSGLTTENTFSKTQIWSKGADVASAASITLGTDGNYFDITGTTGITSISTVGVGAVIKLHFDGNLTLTHHATNLILPGGRNINTAAGDEIEIVEYATGMWRCTKYQYAAHMSSGGVVSSGSNSNGSYLRLADGTQICRFTGLSQICNVASGPIFTSTEATWTYPATFVDTPEVTASSSTNSRWAAVTPGPTSALVRQYQTATSATATSVSLIAIGRWF